MSYENELDKYLKIKTTGRDDSNYDFINYPYEATPYEVLEGLANSEYIHKNDLLIDFGCGKGRVGFFLAYYKKAKVIGVELAQRLYLKACENQKTALSQNRVSFVWRNAKEYQIPDEAKGAYFFNPFAVEVLASVINNIRESLNRNPRDIILYFYYPSHTYKNFLMQQNDIVYIETISCNMDNKLSDERECIMIYKIK